jgi:Protein of unknown function (DUF2975)
MHPTRAAATAAHILDQVLAIAWYGLLVAAPVYVAMVLLTYLAHVDTLGVHLDAQVAAGPAPGAAALTTAGGGAATAPHGLTTITFTRLPAGQLAVHLAVWVLNAALYLPILHQLRKLFAALAQGRPFVRDNAMRLRTLGVVLIGTEVARTALRLGQGAYVAWTFTSAGLRLYPLTLVLRTTVVFVGAALIVVAEAFRRGAELEDDQAFTV